MKIDGLGSNTLIGSNKPTRTAEKAGNPAAASGESVALSAGARGGNEAAPVDAARVQEIRQAISEGRFQINTGAIADRLIESARELVAVQRQS